MAGYRASKRAFVALVVAACFLPILATTPAEAAGPTFVQQVSKRANATSVALQPASNVTGGNRLVVEVGLWKTGGRTVSSVTDSAGNTYTKLTSFKASDNTEMSIWTAPVTAGGGTAPTITVTATGSADIGASAVEYSGLATNPDATVVDQLKTATGKTGTASSYTVSSGATAPTTTDGGLALGFYADSGFGDTLSGDPTYTTRVNVSPRGDMEFLEEDRPLGAAGSTAGAAITTGKSTPWLAATVVLKAAAPAAPAVRIRPRSRPPHCSRPRRPRPAHASTPSTRRPCSAGFRTGASCTARSARSAMGASSRSRRPSASSGSEAITEVPAGDGNESGLVQAGDAEA